MEFNSSSEPVFVAGTSFRRRTFDMCIVCPLLTKRGGHRAAGWYCMVLCATIELNCVNEARHTQRCLYTHLFHMEYRHFVIWQAFRIFHTECFCLHPRGRVLHSIWNTWRVGMTTKGMHSGRYEKNYEFWI